MPASKPIPRIRVLLNAGIPVAAAVKAALAEQDLTIREFATKHEVSESNVSARINGSSRHPCEREVAALAAVLGVKTSWLARTLPPIKQAA